MSGFLAKPVNPNYSLLNSQSVPTTTLTSKIRNILHPEVRMVDFLTCKHSGFHGPLLFHWIQALMIESP